MKNYIMPSGKHKGAPISELPLDYLTHRLKTYKPIDQWNIPDDLLLFNQIVQEIYNRQEKTPKTYKTSISSDSVNEICKTIAPIHLMHHLKLNTCPHCDSDNFNFIQHKNFQHIHCHSCNFDADSLSMLLTLKMSTEEAIFLLLELYFKKTSKQNNKN